MKKTFSRTIFPVTQFFSLTCLLFVYIPTRSDKFYFNFLPSIWIQRTHGFFFDYLLKLHRKSKIYFFYLFRRRRCCGGRRLLWCFYLYDFNSRSKCWTKTERQKLKWWIFNSFRRLLLVVYVCIECVCLCK